MTTEERFAVAVAELSQLCESTPEEVVAVAKKALADSIPPPPPTPESLWYSQMGRNRDFILEQIARTDDPDALLDIIDTAKKPCTECGACCRALPAEVFSPGTELQTRFLSVPLSPADAARIPAELQVPHVSYNLEYRNHSTRMGTCGEDCIALKGGLCTVYENRPELCAKFHRGSFSCRSTCHAVQFRSVTRFGYEDIEFAVWERIPARGLAALLRRRNTISVPMACDQQEHDAFMAWLEAKPCDYLPDARKVFWHYNETTRPREPLGEPQPVETKLLCATKAES